VATSEVSIRHAPSRRTIRGESLRLSRRLLYLLLGFASVFVIIWGIRASAAIIN
jgi:hypothetical protein